MKSPASGLIIAGKLSEWSCRKNLKLRNYAKWHIYQRYTFIHCILLAIQRFVEKGKHIDAFQHIVVNCFRIQNTVLTGTRTHHDYITRLS